VFRHLCHIYISIRQLPGKPRHCDDAGCSIGRRDWREASDHRATEIGALLEAKRTSGKAACQVGPTRMTQSGHRRIEIPQRGIP
jgi:hypothetical protein